MNDLFEVGQKILTKHNHNIKIMAIVDGYVMAKYSRCMPFCDSLDDFKKRVDENKL